MKKIVITFDKRGGSKMEAFGFTGTDCIAATKSIEEAIGKAEERKMKGGGPDQVVAEATVQA